RFFSIAAFAGLVAASHVAATKFEAHDSHLQSRETCSPGDGRVSTTSGKCDPCTPGKYGVGGSAQCQTCPAGSTSAAKASTCYCQAGYYIAGGTTRTAACTACSAGSSSAEKSSSCFACSANQYSSAGGTCTTCPSGSTSSSGSSVCSCTAGKYFSNGKCETCSAGSYSSAGATSCTSCPADTFSSEGGASSCTPCPSGTGSNTGSTSASQCASKCPAGQVYSASGCSSCPAGTYSSNNACSACPAGMISSPGSTTCSVCPGGSIPAANKQSCSTCPADTFSSGGACSPCPAGSSSPAGSTSCGPQASKRALPPRSASQMCQGAGFMRCDVLSGMGGSECINTMTTLDSCGGCVGPEGEEHKYTGRDCSAIKNVNEVKCQAGRCNITSCRSGYEPSGGFCVPSADHTKRSVHGSRSVKRALSSRHDSF
ncbi:hypothetical protein BDV93DRAFT_164262, partial [Ceratobasidium sp. AG-I]